MKKVIWNDNPIYCFQYALIIDENTWHKTVKAMNIQGLEYPTTPACTTYLLTTDEKGVQYRRSIVTIRDTSDRSGIQVASLLAHEAMHVVQWVEDFIGEKKFSSEAECYLLQRVLQDLMQDYMTLKGLK